MFDSRQACVQALQDVAVALKEGQRALRVAEVASGRALRSKTGGVTSAAVLRTAPVAPYRLDLDAALTKLERARHVVVLATFAVALEDGMTYRRAEPQPWLFTPTWLAIRQRSQRVGRNSMIA